MATYKGVKGVKVVTKATDPTASEAEGTVWYNSTSPSALKYAIQSAGAWASGTALNTARRSAGSAAATNTAAICAGGHTTTQIDSTESYNGTTWTEVNNLTTARSDNATIGSQTNALTIGGYRAPPDYQATCEKWDGTSWTEVNNILTARGNACAFGSVNTAAILAGGGPGGPGYIVESWNGTCWTEIADLSSAYPQGCGSGFFSSGLKMGGLQNPTTFSNEVEAWNGTAWSIADPNNTGRAENPGSAGQSTTNALQFAGNIFPPGTFTAFTESYNGSAWTEVGDMGTARNNTSKSSSGSGNANAMAIGGANPGVSNLVEEWNDPVYTIKTVTVS